MFRTYDLFEVMPKGELIWRTKVEGHEAAIAKLEESAKKSRNEFRLMHLPTNAVIATINAKLV
jgi:hypothetical protein